MDAAKRQQDVQTGNRVQENTASRNPGYPVLSSNLRDCRRLAIATEHGALGAHPNSFINIPHELP